MIDTKIVFVSFVTVENIRLSVDDCKKKSLFFFLCVSLAMSRSVVFAYHDFGCIGIECLLSNNYSIECVFTYDDDPKENCYFQSVNQLCKDKGLLTYRIENVNTNEWKELIRQMKIDFIFSFYYRSLLDEDLLSLCRCGSYNLHGSLLPRYRGRAPLNWVLVNGEKETGVTLHRMVKRADAGPILGQHKVQIDDEDTAETLHNKLCDAARCLLNDVLPKLSQGQIKEIIQDESLATKFGRRTPSDGEIDWNQSALQIYNLIRAVTKPYPGAFSFIHGTKIIIWKGKIIDKQSESKAGTIICLNPFQVACRHKILEIVDFDQENIDGLNLELSQCFQSKIQFSPNCQQRLLIIGINNFIGIHLLQRLLTNFNYEILVLDFTFQSIEHLQQYSNVHFIQINKNKPKSTIEFYIVKCDIVISLQSNSLSIDPTTTNVNYLRVFQQTFEEDLQIVRLCFEYKKRLIHPSSMLVYGLCRDEQFNENTSNLVVGPIHQSHWIYSISKQLLDRIIVAYGQQGLHFTLFRPFNWIGPISQQINLTSIEDFNLLNEMTLSLIQGLPIRLNKHLQHRYCLTSIDDGISALISIIQNENNVCDQQIINLGNPNNEITRQQLAHQLISQFDQHPLRQSFPTFAGFIQCQSTNNNIFDDSLQDMSHSIPDIQNAKRLFNWNPIYSLEDIINKTLDYYCLGSNHNDSHIRT